jgi:hypothetical protein
MVLYIFDSNIFDLFVLIFVGFSVLVCVLVDDVSVIVCVSVWMMGCCVVMIGVMV